MKYSDRFWCKEEIQYQLTMSLYSRMKSCRFLVSGDVFPIDSVLELVNELTREILVFGNIIPIDPVPELANELL